MRFDELKQILKKQPFDPMPLGLSHGRRVVIRHPDTIVVSPRHVYIGQTAVSRRGVPETPADGDTFPVKFLWLDPVRIISVEPANGNGRAAARTWKRRR